MVCFRGEDMNERIYTVCKCYNPYNFTLVCLFSRSFSSLFSRISYAVAAPLTRLMITAMAEPRFQCFESRHCSWMARDHLENSFPPYY
jgi:hypothetical protein